MTTILFYVIFITDTIERKKRDEEIERRHRFSANFAKEHSSKENLIQHSPSSYSYSSFHLGSSS